jgi:hypothetical protein
MVYYKYDTDPNVYNSVQLPAAEHDRILDAFHKVKPLAKKWKPIKVNGFDDNSGLEGDFPSLNDYSDIPIVSERAWDILQPLIGYCTEALPVIYPNPNPFFFVHIMDVIDCLDEDHSEVRRNSATNRINRIWRYSFNHEAIKDKHIFRLPVKSGSGVFISESFRLLYEAHRLQGLLFQPLPLVE